VKVLQSDVDAEDPQHAKTLRVQLAINAEGINASVIGAGPPYRVDVENLKDATFKSETGENDKLLAATLGPGFGDLLFEGEFDGIDPLGDTAIYYAGLGFDGLDVATTLSFDQVLDPTVDGLLSQLYDGLSSQLPLGLQDNLTLDLAADKIHFQFEPEHANMYMAIQSTDVALSSIVRLAVPEPSGLLLAALGTLALPAVACRFRRNRAA
jgi:hypothetical protein